VTLDRSGWSVDRLRPYAHTVLEEFGAARVMYGSDWPVCLLAARYAEVVDGAERLLADLTADERHLVWRGTAETVYQLDA
jgi:L-fuconolactonase